MDLLTQCKGAEPVRGLKVRYRRSVYIGSRSELVVKEVFTPLVRESDRDSLAAYLDTLRDEPGLLLVLIKPEDGKLYDVVCVEDSRDWETGLCDAWHYELREIKGST